MAMGRIVANASLAKQVYDVLGTPLAERAKGGLVVMSKEEWEAIEETLYINSKPELLASILEGANAPRESFTEFDWRNYDPVQD